MRGAHASPATVAAPAALAVALVACRTDFQPPPATADLTSAPEFFTTTTSSSSTTSASTSTGEPVPAPKFDLAYPGLPGPPCSERPFADTCQSTCGSLPEGGAFAEVCGIPAIGAPARFHRLALDCSCAATDVVVTDLDGDGIDDIAATCASHDGRVAVWYGAPTRPLACPALHAVSPFPWALAAADFDGDGRRDLVSFDAYSTLSLLRGRDDRELAPYEPALALEIALESAHLTATDLNADGAPDLLAYSHHGAATVLGDGDGRFALGQALTFPDHGFNAQVHGRDLLHSDGQAIYIHRSDGLGGFSGIDNTNNNGNSGEILFASDVKIINFTVGDLTGDLAPDLLLLHADGLALAAAAAQGQYGEAEPFGPNVLGGDYAELSYRAVLSLVELDGEPGLELVVHGLSYEDAQTWLLVGGPPQGFVVASYLSHHEAVSAPGFGDFNADGRLDLVFGGFVAPYLPGGIYFLESAP